MPSPQDLLREYAALNRRRGEEGVTPLEYQRWLDLGRQLDLLFPQRPVRRDPGPVRLRVEFESEDALREALMREVRPLGLFVPTPFTAEVGTRFELCLELRAPRESASGAVEVASTNVGPGFSTAALGMGLRLRRAEGPLHALLERFAPRPLR